MAGSSASFAQVEVMRAYGGGTAERRRARRRQLALEGVALSPRVSVLAAMAALMLRAVAFD